MAKARTEAFEIAPIRTEAAYHQAMAEMAKLWGAAPGSAQERRLDLIATLVDLYEREHFPIDPPDPIDAVLYRAEQRGWERPALDKLFGSRSRTSEVLNRKRALSLAMIQRIHAELDIPAEILIRAPARPATAVATAAPKRARLP